MNATQPSLSLPSQYRVIATTVVATAATVLLLVALVLLVLYRFYKVRQRWRNRFGSSFRREAVHVLPSQELRQENGRLKGVIVDENGLDFLFLRKAGHTNPNVAKIWNNPIGIEEQNSIKGVDSNNANEESPFLQETCVSHNGEEVKPWEKTEHLETIPEGVAICNNTMNHSPEVSKSPQSLSPPPPPQSIQQPPPPTPPPPPPSPEPTRMIPKPPSLPIQAGVMPPPPAKPSILLPTKEFRSSKKDSPAEESEKGHGIRPIKLKPLHWDKVSVDVDHSVVWKDINDGFFRFDDDLMKNLFGNNGPAEGSGKQKSSSSGSSNSPLDAQIFILDPRKSQNTAIVLKSLVISRKEILNAITERRELDFDTLEKLTKIAPSAEEAASILQFKGNQTKLADAESFLYYILKAAPSAFIRLNAMLFMSNYDPEILQLKESLQTLELACKELRSGGILLKLLEAVLKAGNMMNAGTPRGNAQGFNLSALLKLANVKSTDGKTSLLHFVVEQVVRFEGKKLADANADSKAGYLDIAYVNKEEMETQYLTLGLPIVRRISTELSNCKKSATTDYDSFIRTCSSLTTRINEIKQVLLQGGNTVKDGFYRMMKGFVEESNEELKVVCEEQIRVMELVKRTTQYYQVGCIKEKSANPLQLFVIVNNFLDMVDQVCIDITRKTKRTNDRNGWSPPMSLTPRTPLRFQNLNTYFTQEKEGGLSSDSDDDF